MQKQTAYVRPMAFTDRLAMIAANEEKEKRKKAVVNYMREFNKSTPPPDELTTEQLERLIANRQQALRLQVVARRGDTVVIPLFKFTILFRARASGCKVHGRVQQDRTSSGRIYNGTAGANGR